MRASFRYFFTLSFSSNSLELQLAMMEASIGMSLQQRLFLSARPARTGTSTFFISYSQSCSRKCTVVARNLRAFEEAMQIRRRSNDKRPEKTKKKRLSLKKGQVSPPLIVPENIPRPPYVDMKDVPDISREIQVHNAEGIARMRDSGRLAAQVLEYAGTLVKPGVTTDEIDKAVHEMIINAGAYPSPLGYGDFPKSVCTSVNECMCHGIPDSRPLKDGDIINIDVTVYLNGYHGDTSKTFFCGDVDETAQQLVRVTEECMMKAISICKAGANYKTIGQTISDHAEKHGFRVVEIFVGHGVGRVFHSQPIIIHHRNNKPGRMVENQTFTIEPILTTGSTNHVMWDDGWTALTADGSLTAQFEHSILITKSGAEILTKC